MEDKTANIDVSQEQPEEKMECDEVLTESESTAELTETTDSSEKATGTEGKPEPSTMASETSGIEMDKSTTSAPEIPCEKADSKIVEKSEQAIDSTGASPPAKKTLLSNIKEFFSPPKDSKSAKEKAGTKPKESRSKSLPPSDKSLLSKDIVNPDEACVISEGEEEHLKKSSEKTGVMKSIRKHLCKMMTRSKSSIPSETAALVCDEETSRIEETSSDVAKPEIKLSEVDTDSDRCPTCQPQWTEVRASLTDKPSYDGTTTMTDITSTGSGADVFSSDKSTKPSETEENTSEEAVAGSLASSPEEELSSDIQDDKVVDECLEKEASVEQVAVTEDDAEKQVCVEKNAEMKDENTTG